MICQEEIIYKGIREIPAGEFKNNLGELVKFKESYKFRYEIIYNGLPTIFEIKCKKDFAFNVAKNYKINDKVIANFVFNIYPTGKIIVYINNIEKI